MNKYLDPDQMLNLLDAPICKELKKYGMFEYNYLENARRTWQQNGKTYTLEIKVK